MSSKSCSAYSSLISWFCERRVVEISRAISQLRLQLGREAAERSASKEDLEDWTQEPRMHLCCLPETSKHRQAGKNDIVQTFDPVKHHGANEARFLNNEFSAKRISRDKHSSFTDRTQRSANAFRFGLRAGNGPCRL